MFARYIFSLFLLSYLDGTLKGYQLVLDDTGVGSGSTHLKKKLFLFLNTCSGRVGMRIYGSYHEIHDSYYKSQNISPVFQVLTGVTFNVDFSF